MIEVRRDRVQEPRQRHVEAAMVGCQTGQRGGPDRDAVIALHPADDLLLGWPAQCVVQIPDHLDGGVVGLGAGVGEEHLAHRHRRALDQHLRQVDHRFVRFGGEPVVERQLTHLRDGGLNQAFVVETQRRAPQAGDGFDEFLTGLVPNPHALAARDDDGPDGLMRLQVGIGMQHVGDIAGGGGVRAERWGRCHGETPAWDCVRRTLDRLPAMGNKRRWKCQWHRSRGGTRTGVLSYFFTGAHAAVQNHALLTRDAKRLAHYFPTLRPIVPAGSDH